MFFFFNDTATTEIYTLSLHDALPICAASFKRLLGCAPIMVAECLPCTGTRALHHRDRKSTRLNSSHSQISYAVFCLKKKNHTLPTHHNTLTTEVQYHSVHSPSDVHRL